VHRNSEPESVHRCASKWHTHIARPPEALCCRLGAGLKDINERRADLNLHKKTVSRASLRFFRTFITGKYKMSFGIRVFDTVLNTRNRKDTVSRNSSSFWREFCLASGWSFGYERVHSLSDLNHFMARKIEEDVVIFSGHGNEDGWHMTNGDALTRESAQEIQISNKNHGKTIIFSACNMANNEELCSDLAKSFQAKRLFAYHHLMHDKYCFLCESILLTLIDEKENVKMGTFGDTDFRLFLGNTDFIKNLNQKYVKTHPMAMYS
jgi:hypothetical protein